MLSYDSNMSNGQDKPNAAPLPSGAEPAWAKAASSNVNGAAAVNGHAQNQEPNRHIWLVTGPAGCGKTTVAEHLAGSLDIPYIEGDLYHPKTNIDKMSAGVPLTDADRWDWLTILRNESMQRINDGSNGVVVACSALKRKYRDVIRVAAYFDHRVLVHFIFLHAPAELLLERVSQRQNHYMGANMVKSQFDILERPTEDEKDVIGVDASRHVDEVKNDALAKVNELLDSGN